MSDNPDKPTGGSAPRSGAGDPARTQQIPRVPREAGQDKPATTPKKRRPGPAAPASGSTGASTSGSSPTPAKKAPAKRTNVEKPAAARSEAPSAPAGSTPAKKAAPGGPARPAAKTTSPAAARSGASTGASGRTESGGRTLTAGDYARTTSSSASSTSVIPAVKDEPATSKPAQTSEQAPAASASSAGGRQASLRLVRVDPWSVTRLAFVVSVALMIVSVVAVTIFWVVLDLTGIWDQLNGSITNVLSDNEGSFDLTDYLGLGRLVGLTLVLSAVNVVLITALATIAAHLYNLAAQLLGGIHVTFSDD